MDSDQLRVALDAAGNEGQKLLESGGYVFAPYTPVALSKAARTERVLVKTEVEELPPAEDGVVQVGEGAGPRVTETYEEKTVVDLAAEDARQRNLLERYAVKRVDLGLYKKIGLTAIT